MFFLEFDPVYDIFRGDSVEQLFLTRFPDMKSIKFKMLLTGIRLHYSTPFPAKISSDDIPETADLTDRSLADALRYWVHADVLRKTNYKPATYKFLDPVPYDKGGILKYNSFAQKIADEFEDYRTPLPYEVQMACSWRTYPGLPEEVILETVRQLLLMNPDAGIKAGEDLLPYVKEAETREEAAAFLKDYTNLYRETASILERLGEQHEPSANDLALYSQWTREWGFTPDAIQKACQAAARGNPSVEYLNGILQNIRATSDPDLPLDTEAVDRSYRITRELQEIRSHIGGRIPTAEQVSEYLELRKNFDYELILLAAKKCRKARGSLNPLWNLLQEWSEHGVSTLAEAEEYLKAARPPQELIRSLFAYWEITDRSPTARDVKLAAQWLDAGYSKELIFSAAENAADAEDPPLYTAKVLHSYQKKGIHTPQEAQDDTKRYQREKREQRIKDRNMKEVERLRALGPLGPYAGERSPEERQEFDEDISEWVERFMKETYNM